MLHSIKVDAIKDKNGKLQPEVVYWKDGYDDHHRCVVQHIKKIEYFKNKSGKQGVRYTCVIDDEIAFLYLEDGEWFVVK